MKTRILVWAFVAALITNGAMIATAVAGPGYGNWDDDEMKGERMAQHQERRMERMAEILELSDSQQAQIQAIHAAAREKNEPLREQLKASRERIRTLSKADVIDEQAIRTELAAQVDAKATLVVARSEVHKATLEVLNPEQRELAEKLAPRKGYKKHGRHGLGGF